MTMFPFKYFFVLMVISTSNKDKIRASAVNIWTAGAVIGNLFDCLHLQQMKRSAGMFLEGSTMELKCQICFGHNATWLRLSREDGVLKIMNSSIEGCHVGNFGDFVMLSLDEVKPWHEGVYLCVNDEEKVRFVYAEFHVEVSSNEPIERVNGTKNLKPMIVPNQSLEVTFNWTPWSDCSQCGRIGVQQRLGVCTVKTILGQNDSMHGQLRKFESGIPCRSKALPGDFSKMPLIARSKSKLMSRFCKVECSSDGFTFSRKDKQKFLKNLNEYKRMKKSVVRSTTTVSLDSSVELNCPGYGSKHSIRWKKGEDEIKIGTIDKKTCGRLSINFVNRLCILNVRQSDSEFYRFNTKRVLRGCTRMEYLYKLTAEAGKWQKIQAALAATIVTFQSQHDIAMGNFTASDNWTDDHVEEYAEDYFYEPPMEPCTQWVYDKRVWDKTVTEEFELVCDRVPLISFAQIIYTIGAIIGSLSFAQLGDRFGRKLIVIISLILWFLSSLILYFSVNYLMFVVLRFFVAATTIGTMIVSVVWLIESLNSEGRAFYGMIPLVCWCFGLHLLTMTAYTLRNWSKIQLALTIPLLVAILVAIKYTIDSPAWLLMQRRYEDAMLALKNIAGINNWEMPSDEVVLADLKTLSVKAPKKSCFTLLDLFKTRNMRIRSLILFFNSFCDSFLYSMMTFHAVELQSNVFWKIVVAALVQIGGLLASMYLLRKYGRRYPIMTIYCICGVICICTIFIPQDHPMLKTWAASIGSSLVSMAGSQSIIFASELFPTVVRCMGIAAISTASRAGSIIAPICQELSPEEHQWLFEVVNAILAFATGMLALLLPETKNEKLPNTFEDAEKLGSRKLEDSSDGEWEENDSDRETQI